MTTTRDETSTAVLPEQADMEFIRAQAARLGKHWFDPSTMRFFASRVSRTGWRSGIYVYFTSSEQFLPSEGKPFPRLYSVRRINLDTGDVDTLGEFQAYATNRSAAAAAYEAAFNHK